MPLTFRHPPTEPLALFPYLWKLPPPEVITSSMLHSVLIFWILKPPILPRAHDHSSSFSISPRIWDPSCPFCIPTQLFFWDSLIAQTVKSLPAVLETQVQSLGWEDPLKKEMATHSSILACKIPWMEETWQVTVHGVAESWTQLSDFTSLHFAQTPWWVVWTILSSTSLIPLHLIPTVHAVGKTPSVSPCKFPRSLLLC